VGMWIIIMMTLIQMNSLLSCSALTAKWPITSTDDDDDDNNNKEKEVIIVPIYIFILLYF
jgi:hypothetical protein